MSFPTTPSLRLAAPTLAATLALAAPSDAQCFNPDNLTGPCWQITQLNLPQLDAISLEGSGLCWDSCALAGQNCVRIFVDPPSQTGTCGEFKSSMRVFDCSTGAVLLIGDCILDYTRTWVERGVDTAGNAFEYQAWRFCLKADLGLTQPGAFSPTCPVPQSLAVLPSAFFYGYVDYARDCINGTTSNALVLFHNCDHFMHNALSDFPGVFEPTTTYAIVGPDTPANPFVPANTIMPPGGPLVGEATRTVTDIFGAPICTTEDPISSGLLLPFFQLCFCPFSIGSPYQTLSLFEGTMSCFDPVTLLSGSFEALNFFPTVPWPWLVSSDIGSWTTDASYPGPERVWASEGFFRYTDSCIASTIPGTNPNSVDIFYGATTAEGLPVFPVVASQPTPMTDKMIDLASNFSYRLGGTGVTLPILGSIRPTDHLIYANVP